jgi:hypothetical protein
MAEGRASDVTIMALAGHVSRKMMERYSHVRAEAKRAAVAILDSVLSFPTQGPHQFAPQRGQCLRVNSS